MSCYGCICNHCLYNVELESWYFTPGEVQNVEDVCFVCDECKHYDGSHKKRSLWREECNKHKFPCKYEEQRRKAEERNVNRRRDAFRIAKKEEHP